MVKSSVAYVVCPSVPAHAPDALFDQVVDDRYQLFSLFRAHVLELSLELLHLLPEFAYLSLGRLRRFKDRFYELLSKHRGHPLKEFSRVFAVLVYRHTETESEFGGIFEERVAPCRSPSLVIDCPWGRREVAAVNGTAPRGVCNYSPVSEEG